MVTRKVNVQKAVAIEAQRIVAPDYLKLDPAGDAKKFHAYSAGRKRAMAKLILIAFRSEYGKGGIDNFVLLQINAFTGAS